MAIFSDNNFASPFGVLAPSGFFNPQGTGYYSYSGFSNRQGASGFSGMGWSGFSGYCGSEGLSFFPFMPTLTYPMNYDSVSGNIYITWRESEPRDPCGRPVSYEIQFTRDFSRNRGWKTIFRNLPEGTSYVEFDFSTMPSCRDAGLRIRSMNDRLLTSEWSSNAVAFAVADHQPNPVRIIYPTGGETVDNIINILWQEPDVKSIDGRMISYKIEITPAYSTGIGWVQVPDASTIPQGTISYTVQTSEFPEGDDYGVRVISVDDRNIYSFPSSSGPFKVRHKGTFFVDTLPPLGSVIINDGDPLANDIRVRLEISAFDATTGVKEMRIRNADEGCWSTWDTFAPQKFWNLTESDGLKRIYIQLRDYAGNVSSACDCEVVSRVLCDEGNVTDLQVFNNKLYVSFDLNGNVLEYRAVVKPITGIIQPQVTAMAKLGNALYLGVYDPTSTFAAFYKYDTRMVSVLTGITSKILSMAEYNGYIYAGLGDGRILSFNGTSVSNSHGAGQAVTRLRNDGNLLYAALGVGGNYLTFDGVSWVSQPI